MQEKAKVVKVEDGYVWVDNSETGSGCNSCSAKAQCGTGILSEFLQQKSAQLRLNQQDYPNLQLGDHVIISIEENLLLKISLLIYGLPLAMLLISALISQNFSPILQIVTVVVCTFGGVWCAKQFAHSMEQQAMRLIKLELIA